MKRFVSVLLILMLGVSICAASALADSSDSSIGGHTHEWRAIRCQQVDDKTHKVTYKCENDLCGMTKEENEPHNLGKSFLNTDGTEATLVCSGCSYKKTIAYSGKNWMSLLPDDAPLGQINLPGTGASATHATEHNSQKYTVTEQLNMGVRFLNFDIDASYCEGSWDSYPEWPLCNPGNMGFVFRDEHGDYYDVPMFLEHINNFLAAHSTEVVVLLVGDAVNGSYSHKRLHDEFFSKFSPDRSRSGKWGRFAFYGKGKKIPKLGDVRGQCLILCGSDGSMDPYIVSGYPSVSNYEPKKFDYNQYLLHMAMDPMYNHNLQDYSRTSDTFTDNNLRLTRDTGEPNVKLLSFGFIGASYPNNVGTVNAMRSDVKSMKYWKGQRIGWVLLPMVDEATSSSIWKTNQFIYDAPIETPSWPESVPQVDYDLPLNKWMSYFPDNTQISQLNIPGTHDTGCRYIRTGFGFSAQTQDKTIPEQMNAGIRVLDVRAGGITSDDPLTWEYLEINHGGLNCFIEGGLSEKVMKLHHVFEYVDEFLAANPSETIIMVVCQEGFYSSTKEDAVKHIREMAKEVDKDRTIESTDKWKRFMYYDYKETVPLLGDCRGKCIVLWDYNNLSDGTTGFPMCNYDREYDESWNRRLECVTYAMLDRFNPYLQDYSKRNDIFYAEDKSVMRNVLHPGNPNVKYVGYNTNTMADLEDGPAECFKNMKTTLESFAPSVGRRVGWVGMDFPTKTMVKHIINSNLSLTTVGRVNLLVSDAQMMRASSTDAWQRMMQNVQLAFACATMYNSTTGETVDILGADAWQKNEETGGYTLYFRVYDKDDANGDAVYDLKFPNASGKGYTITKVRDKSNYEVNKDNIKDLFVHAVEWDVIVDDAVAAVTPQTGDVNRPDLWGAMMILLAIGMIALVVRGKKAK